MTQSTPSKTPQVPCAGPVIEAFRGALATEAARVLQGADRGAVLYMRLHGLDGRAPESLRKTAAQHGLSAERVRQVCERIDAVAIPALQSGAEHLGLRAALDAVLEQVASSAPASAIAISRQLEGGTDAATVVRLADILGRNGLVRLERCGDVEAILHAQVPRCFESLMTHARKLVGASGAVSASILAESFSHHHGIHLSEAEVETLLAPLAVYLARGPELEGASGWYTFNTGGNDAVTRARNRIGSLGRCSLVQLCSFEPAGTRTSETPSRSFTRSRYLVKVPAAIMAALLRAKGFEVKDDQVTVKALQAEHRLSTLQAQMVGILRKLAGTGRAPQHEFVAACEAAGIKSSTIHAYLYRSGLFRCTGGYCQLAA